jgi:hypothetical protein
LTAVVHHVSVASAQAMTRCRAPTLLCCQMCTAQGTHTAASTSIKRPIQTPCQPDTATHRWTRQETEVTAAHTRGAGRAPLTVPLAVVINFLVVAPAAVLVAGATGIALAVAGARRA